MDMRTNKTNAIVALLVLVAGGCSATQPMDETGGDITLGPVAVATGPAFSGNFIVHAEGKMCLDFGGQAWWAPGAPVTLYWCNGTIAQQFNVQEVAGAGHDVTLHVGNGDNNYCIGARGGHPVAGAVLEMQTCNGTDAQQFALDGDSIIAGHRPGIVSAFSTISLPPVIQPIARELVARPLNDVTNAKTPIVLGPRQLTDNEYLRFVATDGSNRKPHSGFVSPVDGATLWWALLNATWGTVVDLGDTTYALNTLNNNIPSGVTLRGTRKFSGYGTIIQHATNEKGALFVIGTPAHDGQPVVAAHDVRVTGLDIQGSGSGFDQDSELKAITVYDDGASNVIIDHNAISQFSADGIEVNGTLTSHVATCTAAQSSAPQPHATPVRISGNFIHHIIGTQVGYGVVVGYGGFPLVERNLEYDNRHSLTSSYDTFNGYVATDNYILHQAPIYPGPDHVSNFDVHGSDYSDGTSGPWCHTYWGGYAGDYYLMLYNTFLTNDRQNVLIRGESCRQGLIDGNIFATPKGYTVNQISVPWKSCTSLDIGIAGVVAIGMDGFPTTTPSNLVITDNNLYDQPAQVNELAVGDFDGDGIDDVFTTTGNGWWFSSGGVTEWRWLRRASDKVDSLRVGDLDGDGRADVIRVNGRAIEVSWAGISGWQTLTTAAGVLPITSYAIGNFDGDRLHGDDIFATNGATWFVAKNGHNFVPTQTSSVPATQLRFGDFDGDGKTDVFAIVSGRWSYSSAAAGSWQPLAGAPYTSNVDGLIAGDFNGDGRSDIGRYSVNLGGWVFEYAPGASASFIGQRQTSSPAAWSGHFAYGSGVIWWDGDDFFIGVGSAPNASLSRPKMK